MWNKRWCTGRQINERLQYSRLEMLNFVKEGLPAYDNNGLNYIEANSTMLGGNCGDRLIQELVPFGKVVVAQNFEHLHGKIDTKYAFSGVFPEEVDNWRFKTAELREFLTRKGLLSESDPSALVGSAQAVPGPAEDNVKTELKSVELPSDHPKTRVPGSLSGAQKRGIKAFLVWSNLGCPTEQIRRVRDLQRAGLYKNRNVELEKDALMRQVRDDLLKGRDLAQNHLITSLDDPRLK